MPHCYTPQDRAALRWLFLDLNSYFASVEQQVRPELRGRPVIVTPVASDRTCAIAASYEAKAFGIRTGTSVRDARRMCPGLRIVNARHDLYVEYNHRIVDEIERHLHVTKIYSIDEVACELLGRERQAENALALAREVQQSILDRVGICLRSSVGIGPSVLLAKTASDMKKPAGLMVLSAHELPGPLLGLDLGDFSGIGYNMEKRLQAAGISDVAALWALSPNRARGIWGSIAGERFWYGLHGIDSPDIETQRHSISHSHVMAPVLRNREGAYLVSRRLLMRASSRLRRAGCKAGGLAVSIRIKAEARREAALRFDCTADTFLLMKILDALWESIARPKEVLDAVQAGVTLYSLVDEAIPAPDLFGWAPGQAEDTKRLGLSSAIDRLNQRYGCDTVSIGAAPKGLPAYMGAKIAFNRVPERADFAG